MLKPKRTSLQSIQRKAWDSRWWRESTTDRGRLLWFHLLSGPHLDASQAPGLLRARKAQIAEELDWSVEQTGLALRELEDAEQIKLDEPHSLILLPALIDCSLPDNPNMAKAALRSYLFYPECELRDQAAGYFSKQTAALGAGFKAAVDDFMVEASQACEEFV